VARTNHAAGKRQREAEKARKKRDKSERIRRNRNTSDGGIPIATAEELQSGGDTNIDPLAPPGSNQGARASGPPTKLFVGGLSWDTNETGLKSFFEKVGDVVEATIILDRDTGESRGIGFVTMADRKAAGRAIKELSGKELDGRSLRVDLSVERRR